MEGPGGSDRRAAVYFIHVDGLQPRHVHTHFLGGNPTHTQPRLDAAASVGFVKLASGGFLMAVSGEDHGRGGIWFFDTLDTTLHAGMTWRFVDFWDPRERMSGGVCKIDDGQVASDCFIGGGGGTSLLTGQDGQIYLIAMTGTSGGGIEDSYAQVFRLAQDAHSQIALTCIWHDKRKLGRWAINNLAFRWSGGGQVTLDGKLVLLATERRTREDDNDTVDGFMRITGQNTIHI